MLHLENSEKPTPHQETLNMVFNPHTALCARTIVAVNRFSGCLDEEARQAVTGNLQTVYENMGPIPYITGQTFSQTIRPEIRQESLWAARGISSKLTPIFAEAQSPVGVVIDHQNNGTDCFVFGHEGEVRNVLENPYYRFVDMQIEGLDIPDAGKDILRSMQLHKFEAYNNITQLSQSINLDQGQTKAIQDAIVDTITPYPVHELVDGLNHALTYLRPLLAGVNSLRALDVTLEPPVPRKHTKVGLGQYLGLDLFSAHAHAMTVEGMEEMTAFLNNANREQGGHDNGLVRLAMSRELDQFLLFPKIKPL